MFTALHSQQCHSSSTQYFWVHQEATGSPHSSLSSSQFQQQNTNHTRASLELTTIGHCIAMLGRVRLTVLPRRVPSTTKYRGPDSA